MSQSYTSLLFNDIWAFKGYYMTSKLFTSAGITTHARAGVTVTKVRFGTDHIRLIKMLSSNKKISVSNHPDDRGDGFLDAVRVDIVELPHPMVKIDALKFLLAHAEFQSGADQAIISDEIITREPKASAKTERAPKAPKPPKQPVSKPSLDSIKARARKQATAEDILTAIK